MKHEHLYVFVGRFEVPDRVSAIQSLEDLNPRRKWNLILVSRS